MFTGAENNELGEAVDWWSEETSEIYQNNSYCLDEAYAWIGDVSIPELF